MTLTAVAPTIVRDGALVVSVSAEGDATVVDLRGEADHSSLPVIGGVFARVIADHDGPVVIDLAGVTFIDIGTVRTLARTAGFLGHRGRMMTLRSPSPVAIRMLALVEISQGIEFPRSIRT